MKKVMAVMLVILASGCGSAPVPAGIVTAKRFEPAHTDVVLMPMTISVDKSATTLMQTYVFNEPDRWVLTVEPYDAAGEPMKTRKVLVTKSAFDAVETGSWFRHDPEDIDHRKAKKTPKE